MELSTAAKGNMAEERRKILILFAHPNQGASEVNVPLAKAARGVEGVTFIDLYALYPTFDIDIDLEQARLLEHDVIIFMHPLYWYSTPAILKEWQDLVLEYGFAYGEGGTALNDKIFFNAITTGGHEEAYGRRGHNQYSIRELLRPLEQTAELCGMTYLAPFVVFAARRAKDDGMIEEHVQDWVRLLNALADDTLPLAKAVKQVVLNADIEALIEGGSRWKLF